MTDIEQWDPRVDSGGRRSDHPDFGTDKSPDPALVVLVAAMAVIALILLLGSPGAS